MKVRNIFIVLYVICNFMLPKCLAGEKCGVKKGSNYERSAIYYGEDAEMNEYPWMAVLEVDGYFPFCGASLIASQWVLTALHCVRDSVKINVILGEHDLTQRGESEMEKRFEVTEWFKTQGEPDLVKPPDVALLKLRNLADLEIYTPVCLPEKGDSIDMFIGKDAWVTGWGRLESADYPDILQEVKIEVVSNDECSKAMPREITDAEVCAGDRSSTEIKDSCFGDSGGPLSVAQKEGRHTQIGIVSWGEGCGEPGFFGVYSNVVYVNDWIRETMEKNGGDRLPSST